MTAEDERVLIENLGGLLVHEQMHSLERTFKSKFEKLFIKYWNFTKATVFENDVTIRKDQVSNPDAPIAEWLIANPKDSTSFYWVRTLLKKTDGIPIMGKDFTNKVFEVKKTGQTYAAVNDNNNKLISTTIEGIEFYKNAFPVTRGIDHPNEIAAYMFSDYFKALNAKTKPFKEANKESEKNINFFIKWLNEEMK